MNLRQICIVKFINNINLPPGMRHVLPINQVYFGFKSTEGYNVVNNNGIVVFLWDDEIEVVWPK